MRKPVSFPRGNLPPFHELNQRDFSDRRGPPWKHGVRFKQLEFLAKDIEVFDPGSQESNIEAYLLEVEHCLLDLRFPSHSEKLRHIWKTTAKSVHVFIKTLPPEISDSYPALCQALREEYYVYRDEAAATINALTVLQK
ncbi:hypothetical protein ILYODFUR_037929 [Ilyodon furcidens]|uniref:Uncharacterized protein n=1 Tax=Ilyodon furcidens TaxID=33524 RepID=A0ABV0TI44_9TELE